MKFNGLNFFSCRTIYTKSPQHVFRRTENKPLQLQAFYKLNNGFVFKTTFIGENNLYSSAPIIPHYSVYPKNTIEELQKQLDRNFSKSKPLPNRPISSIITKLSKQFGISRSICARFLPKKYAMELKKQTFSQLSSLSINAARGYIHKHKLRQNLTENF